MTKATFKKVNKSIEGMGFELVKGRGYFWFAALPNTPIEIDAPPSVPVMHLKELTLEQWVEAANN